MGKYLNLLLLTVLLTLSACAEKWVKPGANEQDFETAKTLCESEAEKRFPHIYHYVMADGGFQLPTEPRCIGDEYPLNCRYESEEYQPPHLVLVDDNQDLRARNARACLYKNGWRPETSE